MKTRRERVKEATIQEIKEVAWGQIAEKGAAGISINAISRNMGMTAPAFYRYYESRNALLKDLIRDSLVSFRKELESARDSIPESRLAERIFQVYKSWREWAVTNPNAFRLFTELDVWGDVSFQSTINSSHEAVYAIFSELFHQAWESGCIKIPSELKSLPAEYVSQLNRLKRERNVAAPAEVIHVVLHLWGLCHGLISLEVKDRFASILSNPVHLFEHQILTELDKIGLQIGDE
ncbi:TetR/AcrR family transcriptional regulator [Desulforhopalus sp. 52FAK]